MCVLDLKCFREVLGGLGCEDCRGGVTMQAGTRPRTPTRLYIRLPRVLGRQLLHRVAGIVVFAAMHGQQREVAFKVGSVNAICKNVGLWPRRGERSELRLVATGSEVQSCCHPLFSLEFSCPSTARVLDQQLS